jgi:hypothetical protein
MNSRTKKFLPALRHCGKRWLGLVMLGLMTGATSAKTGEMLRAQVLSLVEDRPLSFEKNLGQYGAGAAFVSRGPTYHLSLSPTEVHVTLPQALTAPGSDRAVPHLARTGGTVAYRRLVIELLGANPEARMLGEGEISGSANYFIGNDPAKWLTGVPTYDRVRIPEVYPGIHLLHYGNQHHLEYDFEIAPGASPDVIALRFSGADQIRIDAAGDLILTLGADEIRQPRPVIYQTSAGRRKAIAGGYVLAGPQTVKFSVGEYDPTLPLVIDPVVSYLNAIPGFTGTKDDYVWAIAVGVDGDVYLAGETLSAGLASPNAYQTNLAGVLAQHGDVFVMRRNNDLSARTYFTYLGGSAYEAAFDLAVDADGNAYVTGYTGSTNFPTRNAVQPNIAGKAPPGFPAPALDCFVTKVGPYGTNLVFSTFYGGSGSGYSGVGDDVGYSIALDSSRNVYVAGYTAATNFPTANTSYTNRNGLEDGFLLKLDASGTNVVYAMHLGGSNQDFARDVVVDITDSPIVVGYTSSTNFPVTTNALQKLLNGVTNFSTAQDAFLTKVQATSGAIVYSTFLGGTNNDRALRLATDASGAAYVTGWTLSGNFPRTTTNFVAPVVTNASFADAFVFKLNPGNTNLDYAVVFGGSAKDEALGIAVDAAGAAHVVGTTESLNFPTNGIFDILGRNNFGSADAFLAKINSNATAFEYVGYLGSPQADAGSAVTLDSGGNLYAALATVSGTSPAQPFIVKVLTDTTLAIAAEGENVNVSWPGYAAEFILQASTNLLGGWQAVPSTSVYTNSRHVVTLPATNDASFFRLTK